MIKKIEGLDALITLEELDLYDNQLEKIENLEPLVNLKYKKNYFVTTSSQYTLVMHLSCTHFYLNPFEFHSIILQDFGSFLQYHQGG